MTVRTMYVVRPGATSWVLGQVGSLNGLARAVRDHDPAGPCRATVQKAFSRPGRFGISDTKARYIADALSVPVSQLFQHPDGAELT